MGEAAGGKPAGGGGKPAPAGGAAAGAGANGAARAPAAVAGASGAASWVGGCGTPASPAWPGPALPSPHAANRASAKSRHRAYLSAGDLASALAITWSAAAGRPGRRALSEGGGSDIWAEMTAIPFSRRNGGEPESISKLAQASAYWSVRPSSGRLLICSGTT